MEQEINRRITFLMISQILHAYNKFSDGVLSTKNPETFLNLLFRVSFFFGIYGLFVIFNVSLISQSQKLHSKTLDPENVPDSVIWQL